MVCAICEVAGPNASIAVIAAPGDDAEVADGGHAGGTLSRVMTSCGGIVSATVRRSTRTMRSTSGISMTSPGP